MTTVGLDACAESVGSAAAVARAMTTFAMARGKTRVVKVMMARRYCLATTPATAGSALDHRPLEDGLHRRGEHRRLGGHAMAEYDGGGVRRPRQPAALCR